MKLAPTIVAVVMFALLVTAILTWLDASTGEAARSPQLSGEGAAASADPPTIHAPLQSPKDEQQPEAVTVRTETRASSRESCSVSVRVRWEASGAPASDVAVRCKSDWGAPQGECELRSDANGRVRFDGLSTGPFTFETEFGGRAFAVASRNEPSEVELVAPNTTVLLGQVLDTRKRPVPHAVIWRASFGAWSSASTSDARGYFRVERVAQGEFLAASSPEGALGRARRVPTRGLSEYTLDLVAGGEGRRLVGRVVDPRDAPLADVLVEIDPSDKVFNLQTGRVVRSDRDGRFVIGNLSPKTHKLRLSLVPFAPIAEKVDLAASDDAEHVWRMSPGIVLTGTVRRNGQVQPGAFVFVESEESEASYESMRNGVTTDANGVFRWSGLRPGAHTAIALCWIKDGVSYDLFEGGKLDDAEFWGAKATIEFQEEQTSFCNFELELRPDDEPGANDASKRSDASDRD